MIGDVRGKSVLVIGGSRGIGFAIAKRLAGCGAVVALTARDAGKANAAAKDAGAAAAYALDVRDGAAVDAVVETFARERGSADALVYSAGISPAWTSGEKLDRAAWDDIIAVNLTGGFVAAQAFARVAIAAKKAASIVFVGSIAGMVGAGKLAAYSASKAALIGLAKSFASDWARYQIRVNVVAPGYVATDMTTGLRNSESLSQWILGRTPQGRIASADEVADLVVYLASESASYATGAVFTLDGGWTAG